MRVRRAVGVIGEFLLTAGVVVLLFAAYVTWGTGAETAAAQDQLRDEIAEDWSEPEEPAQEKKKKKKLPPAPDLGKGIAVMTIPAFGSTWEWVVVEGVYLDNLKAGPGHYPGTADPGQKGNFAVAGHRTTYGAPFHLIDTLVPGDEIIVDTKRYRYIYEVRQPPAVILPSETWVIDPVPGKPEAKPTKKLLTMTSCHPKWSASHRMYASAKLVEEIDRKAGSNSTEQEA